MSNDEYKKELEQCKFPPLENSLANSFLSRICQNSYADRYSANEALRHPWITRNIEDEVPLSVNESIHSFNTAHSISEVISSYTEEPKICLLCGLGFRDKMGNTSRLH